MTISASRIAIAAAASLLLASPAWAQSGASWAVSDSTVTTITFSGEDPPPVRLDRTPEEMARLFKAACLDTGGTEAGIDAAAAPGRVALVRTTFRAAATRKTPAYSIPLWSGPGVVVARTDGFPTVPEAQCNATFLPLTGPRNLELVDAMTLVLGAPPSNAEEGVRRNGKRKRFSPRWIIDEESGASFVVTAVAMRASRFTPGDHVLIAVRPAPAQR